jgi:hypothetical protein
VLLSCGVLKLSGEKTAARRHRSTAALFEFMKPIMLEVISLIPGLLAT